MVETPDPNKNSRAHLCGLSIAWTQIGKGKGSYAGREHLDQSCRARPDVGRSCGNLPRTVTAAKHRSPMRTPRGTCV